MTKYHAIRTSCGQHVHASKKESLRCVELQLMEKAGEIRFLKQQPRYKLTVNGVPICTYVADFRYVKGGKEVIEDVKGIKTATYRIKAKLMRAVFGIEIKET